MEQESESGVPRGQNVWLFNHIALNRNHLPALASCVTLDQLLPSSEPQFPLSSGGRVGFSFVFKSDPVLRTFTSPLSLFYLVPKS